MDECDQINEISFELQMQTILMLMIFAVLQCYVSNSQRRACKILVWTGTQFKWNFINLIAKQLLHAQEEPATYFVRHILKLGVTVSSDLSWKEHRNEVIKKASTKVLPFGSIKNSQGTLWRSEVVLHYMHKICIGLCSAYVPLFATKVFNAWSRT